MTDDITTIELEVESETFRVGTTKGRRLVPTVVEGDSEDEQTLELAQRAISKLRTHKGIKHDLDDEGDRLTLGDLLDRNDLATDDVERERKLSEFAVEQLAVGDVIEVQRLHNGEPKEPKRGVVRDVDPADDHFGARAEVVWGEHGYSVLEGVTPDDVNRRYPFDEVRLGRGTSMGKLYDIRLVDADAVDTDDLLDIRERVLDSAALDDAATDLTVETEREWATANGESERASDLHARVTVSGGLLDDPVTVHCRNLFDFGWTASVEADLDDDTEQLVIRAARNNSPIPTHTRL